MKIPKIGMLILATALVGCTSVKRLPSPVEYTTLGEISGIPCARFWGDMTPSDNEQRIEVLRKQVTSDPAYDRNAPVHLLAISGGGQNGAFGAGLLAGWTASGNRPEFRVVTGISTGALMAPFAFLGPDYDVAIQDMYSKFSTKDVLEKQYIRGLVSADSIIDSSPLREIMMRYFTPLEMEKVGQEYERGRRLFVGTTDLDVQRPVIWNIGAIAASDQPDAYPLIIDVLLASAAIPGAFPPVYFTVENDGRKYDELHVDGGVTSQVFICPMSYDMEDTMHRAGLYGKAHVYLIRNAHVFPAPNKVTPKTMPIISQSISSLLRAQGLGDMHRIYTAAQRNNQAYHAAYIPPSFRDEPDELFDISYMTELFELAYGQSTNGYPWHTEPPDFAHHWQQQ